MVVEVVVARHDDVVEAFGLDTVAPPHIPGRREERLVTAGRATQPCKAIALGEGAVARDSRAASYRPLSYRPSPRGRYSWPRASATSCHARVVRRQRRQSRMSFHDVLLKGGVLAGALSGVGSAAGGTYGAGPQER